MALLRNVITGDLITLRTQHVFGRDQSRVDSYLNHSQVSQIHGTIMWSGQTWRLMDFSRNGIYVNGQRVDNQKTAQVRVNDLISFSAHKQLQWKVIHLEPPGSVVPLFSADRTVIGQECAAILPGNEIFHTSDEENRFFPTDLIKQRINQTVQASSQISINNLHFHFQVSPDEEHVFVKVLVDNQIIDLGERVHHYPLLLMARKRREDLQNGFDHLSQGWIDVDLFKKMTGLDSTVLNMQIYRFRKQLSALLPGKQYLTQIVERRSGELRFSCPNFKIMQGESVEVELSAY